ncbi:MAG: FMN-binding protein [Limnochordia bacterium]
MRLLKALLLGMGGFILIMGVVGLLLMAGQSSIKELSVEEIDFTALRDGVYAGWFEGGRWSNGVEMTVTEGQVVAIEVTKDMRFSLDKARQEVIDRVLRAQSLQIDAVAGATVTTKAYLKAMEDALSHAK